ncbi:hypothetical protein ACXO2Y_07595 [Lactobacillus delbrueckii subsp. bulgaricus]
MNLPEYKDLFSPDNIKIADKLQKSMKKVDIRKADFSKTKIKVVAANIIVGQTLV